MVQRSSAPLFNVWRKIPRAVAGSVGAVAELSPGRAVALLAMTLGFGTSAFVAMASVGGSVNQAGEPPSLEHRPAATASRDAQRPDVPSEDGAATRAETSSPSASRDRRPDPRKTPLGPSSAPRTAHVRPGQDQEALPPSDSWTDPSSSASDGEEQSTSQDGEAGPETVLAEWYPDSDDAVFSFRASERASYECSLDGAPYSSCDSPANFTDLHPGWHTFAVRAIDETGTPDPSPAMVRWHVDASSSSSDRHD